MTSLPSSNGTFHATDVAGTSAPTDRQLYRETVASVAERAKAAMDPAVHGRIDKAVALVLAGDVELLPTGKAQVASQSNGQTTYFVVNGECTCKDFPKAVAGWCKHRLSAAIAKRTAQALTLADARLASEQDEDLPVASETLPLSQDMHLLAPYIVHIHGKPFVQYSGLLALAHARGLRELSATITVHVEGVVAIATAVAVFADGRRFTESGDASPENVTAKVRPHFIRCALTRAKARALRDALGVSMVALEELGD